MTFKVKKVIKILTNCIIKRIQHNLHDQKIHWNNFQV